MFKRLFVAAALVMASSPAFVLAQDFFFSFDEFSRVPTTTVPAGTATGSLFIFADVSQDFNQLDIDFLNSDSSVVSFTGATTFNSGNKFTVFSAEDPNDIGAPITPTDGRLFAVSIPITGPVPGIVAGNTADPDFRAGVNGFLLAQVDYDIAGAGTVDFDFFGGDRPVIVDPPPQFGADFASATLTVVTVPEPSSAILLLLGAAGTAARRRRF